MRVYNLGVFGFTGAIGLKGRIWAQKDMGLCGVVGWGTVLS